MYEMKTSFKVDSSKVESYTKPSFLLKAPLVATFHFRILALSISIAFCAILLLLSSCSDLSVKSPEDLLSVASLNSSSLGSSSSVSLSSPSSSSVSFFSSSSSSTSPGVECPAILATNEFCDVRDGEVYSRVKIGEQIWMAQNVRHSVSVGQLWCANDNDSLVPCAASLRHYYDWQAAKSACPSGWVLPSKMDFEGLFTYLASLGDSVPGLALKAKSNWALDDQGFDKYGLAVKPTGYVYAGRLVSSAIEADFLTRTTGDGADAWMFSFYESPSSDGFSQSDPTRYGTGVRCIEEDLTSEIISCPVQGSDDLCDVRDGQLYPTFYGGGIYWMAQNLNYRPSNTSGSWCYGNDTANCALYGRLYDWNTAMGNAPGTNNNPSGVRGICPAGWHVPSDSEWGEIIYDSTSQGGYFKSTSGALWGSGVGTDGYRVRLVPGGMRTATGNFVGLGDSSLVWSATTDTGTPTPGNPRYYFAVASGDTLFRSSLAGPGAAMSLRCRKDWNP
jgi:uncharacterized protein (TIGR02145 family)